MTKKSWKEKFYEKPNFKIKIIDRSFWGYVRGSKMLIPSPKIIEDYVNQSDEGLKLSVETMREDLAIEFGADFTCPMTTAIFLRIVSEYSYEKYIENDSMDNICPFWRIVDPNSKLADKLSFDKNFIIQKRKSEKIQ